ncbi:GNAT family N-acetyltransferase [Streptomyces albipurpureus]|uniref:GNAT family N-acetyltransferase n=1 Tax=Streptomyces albipurpureus TaxID=2897419 RepID=A0ABT0UU82_9ACTN|nr:GNAT family N-acetyltransferase [Streptomyces sp. CWNU-1]MCM2391952.1 GNAT family N-acetyltransferase [Streptomyces sp. CWNU-1]
MTVELRVLQPSEWDNWYEGLEQAFGGVRQASERRELIRELTDPTRAIAAWDGAVSVGSAGSFGFDVTVPGGSLVRMAGVSEVSVAATHRRRGVLTSMMRRQLDDLREWGEPIAILTASEPAIYGRFGYGVASWQLMCEIDTSRVRFAEPEGPDGITLRRVRPADGLAACEAIYARTVPERPGMIARVPGWDRLQIMDSAEDKAGGSDLQCVLAERDGETVGYTLFRNRPVWDNAGPKGSIQLTDLYGLDPAAYSALWRFLWGIDLTSSITSQNRPVDDPWLHLVSDVRRCDVRTWEGLYVRLVDVGTALATRTYRTGVDLVLEVEDAFCPWNEGRWRLSGDSKGAVCERTADAADLVLSVRELGGAYMGGISLSSLAAAGLVREVRPGALAQASAAFGSDVAPWVPHNF